MSFAQTGDLFTWTDSNTHNTPQPVFTSKQWSYQVDQNAGQYGSKQLIFDLSGFYNNDRWINAQEMFMVIPVNTVLSAVGADNTAAGTGLGVAPSCRTGATALTVFDTSDNGGAVTNQFAMGFKSGFWHLIQSIQISVDGKDLIQMTPNINYFASFVANSTWSDGDVKKWGSILGFYPDSCDSWIFNRSQVACDSGIGVCNNDPFIAPQPYLTSFFKSTDATEAATAASIHTPAAVQANFMSQYGSCSAGNTGFLQRMKWTNFYDPSLFLGTTGITYGRNFHKTTGKDALGVNTGLENRMISETMTFRTAAANVDLSQTSAAVIAVDSRGDSAFRQLHTYCVIRFRDICDLFAKLPISRGLYIRATINLNVGTQVIYTSCYMDYLGNGNYIENKVTYSADGLYKTNVPSLQKFVSTFQNYTCPIMLSALKTSALTGTGVVAGAAGAVPFYSEWSGIPLYPGTACDYGTYNRTQLKLSVSVVYPDLNHHSQLAQTAKDQLKPTHLTSCRVYVPIIELSPALTSDYVTKKEHQIYYRDVISFVFSAASEGSFTHQLANGLVNAKRLVMIPFFKDESVGTAPAAATYDDLKLLGHAPICPFEPTSPYDSAPATTAPGAALSDFQVLISNMNCFQRNYTYTFETFLAEMQGVNSINGGLYMGLQSGQIDYHKWMNNYRYYVVDLSRRLAGDNTPKSITIQGKNNSIVNIEFHVYVEYERHLTLDIETGHVIASSN